MPRKIDNTPLWTPDRCKSWVTVILRSTRRSSTSRELRLNLWYNHMLKPAAELEEINVVLNWGQELSRLAPTD